MGYNFGDILQLTFVASSGLRSYGTSPVLSGILSIEDRWKELALTLCYTRREIDTKFDSEDPIHDILTDFMARGGEADKFLKAMYEVARRLRLIPYEQLMENRENRRMENRDGKGNDVAGF